ncbi:MAG: type II toxin-antitoxin system VapC family toxin [Gammaproteobacteria bacterium]|nr:type II toxin-antitoxin system VapC family toxin [Gammaproteobacteria bacterium]
MIVLDTHVLVWWVNGDAGLSAAAETAITEEMRSPEGLILVSSISAWEIALLIQKGRLQLSTNVDDWLSAVQEIPAVRFVPVNNDIGVQSTRLPDEFHPDPADRIIVALARHMSAPLVTADARIRAYPHVRTIW